MEKTIKIDTAKAIESAQQRVKDIESLSVTRVESFPTHIQARKDLIRVKEISKDIKKKKMSIILPLYEALKNIRSLFVPVEHRIDAVEGHLKSQILAYNERLEVEKVKREKQAEERMKNGQPLDKATKGLDIINQKIDQVRKRKIQKLRITDKSKLPLEYLIPNEVKIKSALLKGAKVAGAEIYEETIIVST